MAPRSLNRDDYRVAWICPLEVEQIAAMEMLDEEHKPLEQSPEDHNVYKLGSINNFNIAIAGLYQPGNCPAATVIARMRMTFPNLRYGLLVGIGGGVPQETDIGMLRLGHVVVSKPTDLHSGVVQYDHGKAEEGYFKRTGALALPPAALLNAAQALSVQRARIDYDPVWKDTQRIQTTREGLRRFKFPGVANDHLYPPSYIHKQAGVSCDKSGCCPNQRIQRPVIEGNKPFVAVHRGTIASGELVIKDATLRDILAKQHGLLCFETEAAGALIDFSCIVIRGISDYCDSHKNDKWHGYAAAAAAAYARQLFFHLPKEEAHRQTGAEILGNVDSLKASICEIKNGQSMITSQLSAILADVPGCSRLQHALTWSTSSAADKIPGDMDLFSRIIRAEVKRALQPAARILEGKVNTTADSLALEISKAIISYEGCEDSGRLSQIQDPRIDFRGSISKPPLNQAVMSAQTLGRSHGRQAQLNEVKLFSSHHQYKSKLGQIHIHISKFRTRSLLGKHPEPFFRIRLDVFLLPWLFPIGISASYSGGMDPFGYYNICPSIRTFRILLRKSKDNRHAVWDVMKNDDIEQFRNMFTNGEISCRDQDESGMDIFHYALRFPAIKVARFLLVDSGLNADYLIEQSVDPLENILKGCLGNMCSWPKYKGFSPLFGSKESEPAEGDLIISLISLHWDSDKKARREFFWDELTSHCPGFPTDELVAAVLPYYSIAKACGFGITADDLFVTNDYPPFIVFWMLELYIRGGGDPNCILDADGKQQPLLLVVLWAVHKYRFSTWSVDEELTQLLVSVIKAGADICVLWENMSLAAVAHFLLVAKYWRAALGQCGYTEKQVWDAIRLKKANRTSDGQATGIDAELLKARESKGLRLRDISNSSTAASLVAFERQSSR